MTVSGDATSILAGLERCPTDLTSAAHGLRTVADRLFERGDPRAAFPDIYGIITDRVALEASKPDGIFWEPRWISRLSGRFCERYLDTLQWSLAERDQDCAAWRIAYRYAAAASTVPFQDVVLGLSAHINYDLAQGISQTIVEFGHAASPEMRARYKHDHDIVNVLLEETIPVAFERLISAYRCRTSALLFGPARAVTEPMTLRVLTYFRATVWNDVVGLLDARHDAERQKILAGMEQRSGRYARAMTVGNLAYAGGRSLVARLPRIRPRRAGARQDAAGLAG
jgi:hypothetical protein